jgi:predicted RNA binding protein YcfA (HicA-like mRNA interferase family)
MNSKKLIEILERDGWRLVATKGSHYQYKHSSKKGRVTAPHPKKEMPIGTIYSIFKQANLSKNMLKK